MNHNMSSLKEEKTHKHTHTESQALRMRLNHDWNFKYQLDLVLEETPVSRGDRAASIFLLGYFLDTGDPSALGHDQSPFSALSALLASIYSLIWPHSPCPPDCFVNVVIGFDISTHLPGQLLFHGHPRLESYLPGILEDITSIRGVSCGAGADTHVNVAFRMNNDQEFPAKFQIYQEPVFDSLLQVTVNGPTHLNAQFLQQLWDTFENKSASQGQVSTSHSISHLLMLPCVSPSQLCISFSHSPLLCCLLSLGVTHLFRWSWE